MSDVLFRGPMLVFYQGKVAESIRIPDGSRQLPGMKHPDLDDATPHFVGMFVAKLAANPPVTMGAPIDLHGMRVTISDGTGPACVADKITLDAMVDLQERTTSGTGGPLTPIATDDTFFTNGATIVSFAGGMLSADPGKPTSLKYTIPGTFSSSKQPIHLNIPMLVQWAPNPTSTGVTIEIVDRAGNVTPVKLAADETACFYHWDHVKPTSPPPTIAEFMDFHSITCTGTEAEIVDIDFKWLYEVLTPPKDWATWLGGKKLPAPESPCTLVATAIPPKTAPGKDCLGGRWGG